MFGRLKQMLIKELIQVVRDKRVTVPAGASSAEIAYAAGEETF